MTLPTGFRQQPSFHAPGLVDSMTGASFKDVCVESLGREHAISSTQIRICFAAILLMVLCSSPTCLTNAHAQTPELLDALRGAFVTHVISLVSWPKQHPLLLDPQHPLRICVVNDPGLVFNSLQSNGEEISTRVVGDGGFDRVPGAYYERFGTPTVSLNGRMEQNGWAISGQYVNGYCLACEAPKSLSMRCKRSSQWRFAR